MPFALLLLPLVGVLAVGFAMHRRRAATGPGDLALRTAVGGGVLVGVITELLSAVRCFSTNGVAWAWGAVALAALVVAVATRRRERATDAPAPEREPLNEIEWLWCGAIVLVLGVAAYLGVVYPPTTPDSMSYHLARVAQWVQHGHVDFYATHNRRQLHMPPWSEYCMAHVLLLRGNDRLVNLVQWGCLIGCLVAVGRIVRELGGTRPAALAAAFLVATLPMVVAQASTTQNDVVVSFWLLCLIYFQLQVLRAPSVGHWLCAGLSLGLAVWTKSTAYVFALPHLTWFGVACLRRHEVGWRRALAGAGLAGVCVLALNGPHYWRNQQLYHSPLGCGYEDLHVDAVDDSRGAFHYQNERLTLPALASNLVRTTAVAASFPVPNYNRWLDKRTRSIHSALAVNVDDPATTWLGTNFAIAPPGDWYHRHEDLAPAPVHLWLFAALCLVALCRGRAWRGGRATLLGWAAVAGLALFCLVLRWQPWHNRLLVPLLITGCVPAALVLTRWRACTGLVSGLVLIAAWPSLVENVKRPIVRPGLVTGINRDALYFDDEEHQRSCADVVRLLNGHGVRHVGWIGTPGSIEYPFWVCFTKFDSPRRCVTHVHVENRSRALPSSQEPLQALVVERRSEQPEVWNLNGRTFRLVLRTPRQHVYFPTDGAATSSAGANASANPSRSPPKP